MTAAPPLLDVDGLTVTLDTPAGPRRLLDGVSFTLARGETLGVVGESGSGKTMLALALIGLLPAGLRVTGRVALDGLDLLALGERDIGAVRGRRIGMIFQEPATALNPSMRAGDQVAEGLVRRAGLSWREARARAEALLERVRIGDPRRVARAFPHELSGGQRQRVGIAIALALAPDLLIADEPTTALDMTVQADILDMVADLVRDSGLSLLIVSHDLGVIARSATRTLVLRDGIVVEEGPTGRLLAAPSCLYREHPPTGLKQPARDAPDQVSGSGAVSDRSDVSIGGAGALEALVAALPRRRSHPAERLPAAPGTAEPGTAEPREETPPERVSPERASRPAGPEGIAAAPLLDIRKVSKLYGGRRWPAAPPLLALDDLSLQIAAGEIFGLIGESGSGKTTLARLVMAFDRPDAGEIRLDGADLCRLPPEELRRRRRDLQMVFQDPYGSLDPRMRVGRSIAEPLHLLTLGRDRRKGLFPDRLDQGHTPVGPGGADRMTAAPVHEPAAPSAWPDGDHGGTAARVAAMLERVGLPADAAARFPHEFSGGQRQRIAIARALICAPRLLVADEPVSALDLRLQAQVLNLLLDIRDRQGIGVLFVSHDLRVVDYIADRIGVLHQGRLVECGPAADVLDRPRHPYTRRLIAADLGTGAGRGAGPIIAGGARDGLPFAASAASFATAPTSAGLSGTDGSPLAGCSYARQCPRATDLCRESRPHMKGDVAHDVACHHPLD